MRVLVTGAVGFVGSQITRAIVNDGHEVWGTVRPGSSAGRLFGIEDKVRVEEIDLGNSTQVKRLISVAQPECCIHLAWYVVPGEFWNSTENFRSVALSLDLAQHLASSGCRRLVGIGSCTEYDWDHELLSEDLTPLRPRTLYGACKNATREMLEPFCQQAGISFAWPRYFFLYGPGEKPQRLVPAVIRSILGGEPVRLNSGIQVRDFLHVRDVAAATWAVAKSSVTGAVNVASGEPVRILTLVETIARIVGGTPRLNWGAIPDGPQDVPTLRADVRKLRQGTGWTPAVNLEDGLRQTVEWWKLNSEQTAK